MKIWRRKSLLVNGSLVVIMVAVGIASYLVIRPTRTTTALQTSTVRHAAWLPSTTTCCAVFTSCVVKHDPALSVSSSAGK